MFKKSIHKIDKKVPESLKLSPSFAKYRDDCNDVLCILMGDGIDVISKKKIQATQRFNEFLWRLDQRFQNLKQIESFISYTDPSTSNLTMTDLQLEFVNRTEAYYQQLYASLSAFAMYLNHVATHSFKKGLPIAGIDQFLKFLKTHDELNIGDELKELERARVFRSKFVDHIQQHSLHDWMTYSHLTEVGPECVVIYYIAKGPEVFYRGNTTNPYSPEFEPPINYQSYYISPPHNKCHVAILNLCKKIIFELAKR